MEFDECPSLILLYFFSLMNPARRVSRTRSRIIKLVGWAKRVWCEAAHHRAGSHLFPRAGSEGDGCGDAAPRWKQRGKISAPLSTPMRGTTGLEPAPSSVSRNATNRMLLTVQYLRTGTTGKNGHLGGICDKNATNFLRAFGLAVWDQPEEYRSNRTG